ncbi:NADH-quinone oxidoreductase subunit G [Wenzhouxiangella sp. XN79A]|uniref:NADH-quinone oxidoreductase subunit NuoG n=1 Tax=Wenzhouxiangella sp. XN79A TaxID=2724193 RepID=UPI00144A8855|nr:NADH-quinone oxidoreductase subunit NuoG [Wenzhouxiangella sp. XN79A]NKI35732.1 NADH-quinone oxidoreductase subunit G [Wenzhouxiangella sp. XN79A]
MATVENKPVDTVTIEVDGRELQARKGQMIIEITDQAGIEIPRFCYHKKLSIAANCRMCLVDVEKAPKPLPACATPVADGMKVFTRSRRAVDAQRGVMEFLLINHPLDCPICDQGGECELQDLAMGYGRSISRFTERKRVVKDKNLGPLVATDMTRCIHCTRCVRFLEEIAGSAELGDVNRGEKTEISTFIERNIESELSGNIIDLCPVGALTNKPFRFSARAWEMSAKPYIGTHDCVGSNLFYHVRRGEIMRSVPRDAERINECWLADRDRYSHFGLAADDRVTAPRIKRNGEWETVDWPTALAFAAQALRNATATHGADQLGVLVSPRATSEEHRLLRQLADGLGTPNIDHRLRVSDPRDPNVGRARLDRPMQDLSSADAVFLVGSYLRHDQPILNHRVRTAWRSHGARIMDLNPIAWDLPYDLTQRLIVPPQQMVVTLARVLHAAYQASEVSVPDSDLGRFVAGHVPDEPARAVAETLRDAERACLLLGDVASAHPQAAVLRALADELCRVLETARMFLPAAANAEGAWRAGAVPGTGGLSAAEQIASPRQAYLLYDLEPEFDLADPAASRAALDAAEVVVAVASFAGTDLLDVADVLLPLSPAPETDGSYVNADGTRQWLTAAARSPGDARPGWKILRVLGERLELDGFEFTGLNQVDPVFDESPALSPELGAGAFEAADQAEAPLWRVGVVPMFGGDALLRRAEALQATDHADHAYCVLHPSARDALALGDAERVMIGQGDVSVTAPVRYDDGVPPGAAWLPVTSCLSSRLGAAWGPLAIEASNGESA